MENCYIIFFEKGLLEEYENVSFIFKVDCPANWSELVKERVKNQFNKLDLASRYPTMIGESLSRFLMTVKRCYRENGIKAGKDMAYKITEWYLEGIIEEKVLHKNHYELIMLRALLEDNWFWDEYMKAQMQREDKY